MTKAFTHEEVIDILIEYGEIDKISKARVMAYISDKFKDKVIATQAAEIEHLKACYDSEVERMRGLRRHA